VNVADLLCSGVRRDRDLIERLAVGTGCTLTDGDEGGRELGKPFARRVRPKKLVARERQLAGVRFYDGRSSVDSHPRARSTVNATRGAGDVRQRARVLTHDLQRPSRRPLVC
jgi:hypothetical protein